MIIRSLFLLIASAILMPLNAQEAEKKYKVACVGFWNFENLFDTEDTPDVRDSEFTPDGRKNYTKEIYKEKQGNLAEVISQLGTTMTPDGLAILGVCEVENKMVLEDLVAHKKLEKQNYSIVHYDSPDKRGIDVALLYQPKYFEVTASQNLPLMIYEDKGNRIYTRDILFVSGIFDGEPMHVLVNHWPSRSGGEARSAPRRNAAAALCRSVIDSLQTADPDVKVIVMGDMNDDPSNKSMCKILRAKGKQKKVMKGDLFNPMYEFYKKGIGTTAWRDAWSLFDQIAFSEKLLDKRQKGYFFHKAAVHNKKFMVQKTGQFKGYPLRTFVGDTYMGGYSDHFPVYIYLLKEK